MSWFQGPAAAHAVPLWLTMTLGVMVLSFLPLFRTCLWFLYSCALITRWLYQTDRRTEKHWTQKPKVKLKSLTGRETKCIESGQMQEISNTQPRFSPQTENAERLMVSTPWEHTTTWAGELQPSYKVSQLTDCSQLREGTSQVNPIDPDHLWPRSCSHT